MKFTFPTTNNEAEYEALIAGLNLVRHLEVSTVDIFSDSQLVVKQILGEFKTLNERMNAYVQTTSRILQSFTSWTINNIDRTNNRWADALSKLATTKIAEYPDPIYVKEITHPSTKERG